MSTLINNAFAADLAHRFGKPIGDLFVNICTTLDTVGGDETAVFASVSSNEGTSDFELLSDGTTSTLTLTGVDATTCTTIITGGATSAGFTVYGDSATYISLLCDATTVAFTFAGATGECELRITPNRADALSITDQLADYLVFSTTTSALAVRVAVALVSTPPANQTLTNSATITLPVGINKVVDNGGAVTGIIMTAGLYDGQIVNIINAAAASVTFATAGTSNVADGTSAVIAANRAVTLIYDSGSSLWYRTG